MTKEQLRKNYLEQRKAITEQERAKLDDLLLIQLQRIPLMQVQTLFSYIPMEHMAEPNTYFFTRYLETVIPELQTAYPITDLKNSTMEAFLTDDDTEFVKNRFGTIEPVSTVIVPPQEIDLVFTPLLVADERGYRVGFGKGIYDKYLQQCRNDVLKIGFCYFDPVAEISDIHKNDIPLDILITPFNTFEF